MRVIRPQSLTPGTRRRAVVLALSMLGVGALAVELAAIGTAGMAPTAVMAGVAALGLGIGTAWLLRALRPERSRRLTNALVELLAPTLDDTYTLVVAPRLPVRDAYRLDGVLVGPGGVRVLTVRDWEGRYRVRGRVWEFDARGRRGWIRCRTNPSFDAVALAEGVARWARERALPEMPLRPVVAFPRAHSRIVLEEPEDEIITSQNAPWWANTMGRVRRLDAGVGARVLEAILDAGDPARTPVGAALPDGG